VGRYEFEIVVEAIHLGFAGHITKAGSRGNYIDNAMICLEGMLCCP